MNDSERKHLWYIIICVNIFLLVIVAIMVRGAINNSNESCNIIGNDVDCKYKFFEKRCYCDNHNFSLTKEDVINYNKYQQTILTADRRGWYEMGLI